MIRLKNLLLNLLNGAANIVLVEQIILQTHLQ